MAVSSIANGQRLSGASARVLKLIYVSDQSPGIQRKRRGRTFCYMNSRGQPIRSPRVQSRIRGLAIPPAWKDVWICSNPRGHLQATGRDARGRKQYVYHNAWQTGRNDAKFSNLRKFGRVLPRVRRKVARMTSRRILTRDTVLATIVMLLDETLMRVGNEEYVRQNDSFGLTTLRDRHARGNGLALRMRFQGKSGIQHDVCISNRRLARIVRQCQELPGQRLFQYYEEDGSLHPVTSTDVNEFLQTLTGKPFTAKEFRTWRATALVLAQLRRQSERSLNEREKKKAVQDALRAAATALGNTITVCRKYYVHPGVIALFMSDRLGSHFDEPLKGGRGLEPTERVLLNILRKSPPSEE